VVLTIECVSAFRAIPSPTSHSFNRSRRSIYFSLIVSALVVAVAALLRESSAASFGRGLVALVGRTVRPDATMRLSIVAREIKHLHSNRPDRLV
jgi:hypothetical protein